MLINVSVDAGGEPEHWIGEDSGVCSAAARLMHTCWETIIFFPMASCYSFERSVISGRFEMSPVFQWTHLARHSSVLTANRARHVCFRPRDRGSLEVNWLAPLAGVERALALQSFEFMENEHL